MISVPVHAPAAGVVRADAAARVARLEGRATAPAPKAPAVLEGTLILDPAKPETARKVLPRATEQIRALREDPHAPPRTRP